MVAPYSESWSNGSDFAHCREPECEPANLKGGVRTRFANLPLAKDRAAAARIR